MCKYVVCNKRISHSNDNLKSIKCENKIILMYYNNISAIIYNLYYQSF